MTKEQILKNIEECIKYNKAARQAECGDLYKDATRRSNDVLARAKRHIENADEFSNGMETVWKLTKFLVLVESDGGEDAHKIMDIFGMPWYQVIRDCSIEDIVDKWNAYKKKKEEEAAKPKLGDVVELHIDNSNLVDRKAIFLNETGDMYCVLYSSWSGPQLINKRVYSLKKTGEHVDIQGMLDKLNE